MKKELDYRDDELIDLGAVSQETHGFIPGNVDDEPQLRAPLGIIVD